MWVVSVILVVAGIVQVFQGQILFGVFLLILGFGIGPGGFSFFKKSKSKSHA